MSFQKNIFIKNQNNKNISSKNISSKKINSKNINRENNRGSATLEATLVLPIFIFGMLVLFHGIRLRMTEAVVYEAAAETVEYMAELSYITECNYLTPMTRLGKYIDNAKLVETYIVGGVDGISFLGTTYLDEEGYVCLRVNYQVGINVPMLGNLSKGRSYELRQKAYIGDKESAGGEEPSEDETYVFITDNREVYHAHSHHPPGHHQTAHRCHRQSHEHRAAAGRRRG